MSRRERGLRPLDEAQAGETVTVASVFERDRTLLEYLDGVGIRPGARLEVGPELEIQVDGRTVRVERAVAAKVWVQNSAQAPAKNRRTRTSRLFVYQMRQ